jgi:hypothetical protein
MYTIDCSKYCAKNESDTMIIAPRRHQHPSTGTHRPSVVTVTANFNAEYNLMAVNPIIDYFSRDLVPEYCHGLESSAVSTAPPIVVKSLHGPSNRSISRLPLHMHAEEIILTFLTLNISIGPCLPKANTLTRLQSDEMFEVMLIVRNSNSMGLRGILNFRLLRDAFPDRLARGIHPKKRVLYLQQSKVRTPPPYLC